MRRVAERGLAAVAISVMGALVVVGCAPRATHAPLAVDAIDRIVPGCPPADGRDDFGLPAPAAEPGSGLGATVAAGTGSGAGAGVRLACVASVERALGLVVVPGAPDRWLVAAQDGQAWLVTAGVRADAPLLDLGGIVSRGAERGLLGIALHPRFPLDPRVFVAYTNLDGGTVVASYRVDPGRLDRRQRPEPTVLLRISQPAPIHNGGGLLFGPDGLLYVAVGDGGGDPMDYTDTLDSPLGSILRIDVDRRDGWREYGIPADNPFVGTPGARPEIWLRGFRNPWRIAIDRATGDLWIADVGANTWEEVNVARAGERGLHFGWPTMEGSHCHAAEGACARQGLTPPVVEYPHGERCAVTGGVVYRGASLPHLLGRFVFADFCTGELFAADGAAVAGFDVVGRARPGVAAIVEDAAGELLVLNVSDGTINRALPG